MDERKVKYKEFFDVLQNAIKDGHDIKKSDAPKILKCGFIVDGTIRYLMRVAELKYAKDNGVDVSLYMDLQE